MFVFVVAIVLVAIGGLAANALLNTSNIRTQRTSIEDAESAVTVAMQYLRYQPPSFPPTCAAPSGITIPSSDPRRTNTNPVQLYCTENVFPTLARTRVLQLYACPTGTSVTDCTTAKGNVLLHAEVAYDDLDAEAVDNCFVSSAAAVDTSCGLGMNVDIWDVVGADD